MTCLTLCKMGSSSLWSWGKGKQGTSPTYSRRKKRFCQQKDRSRTELGYLHRSSVAAGTKAAMDSYSSSSQPGLREHFMSRSVDRWAMDSYTESASSPCISSSLMWLFSMSTVSWKRGRAPRARWHSRALWAASGARVGLWQFTRIRVATGCAGLYFPPDWKLLEEPGSKSLFHVLCFHLWFFLQH